MSSSSSRRTTPLPPDWPRIRTRILNRDGHRCRWITDGHRCTRPARDVDHVGAPDDHTDANLRALCTPHHLGRTARQAAAARWSRREQREPEPHPGDAPTEGGG